MGRVVEGDLRKFERVPGWHQADKIEELVTDKGLSKDYLAELIKDANSKDQLKEIAKYLMNEKKTYNLNSSAVDVLLKKIASASQYLGNNEALKSIVDAIKEHGADAL